MLPEGTATIGRCVTCGRCRRWSCTSTSRAVRGRRRSASSPIATARRSPTGSPATVGRSVDPPTSSTTTSSSASCSAASRTSDGWRSSSARISRRTGVHDAEVVFSPGNHARRFGDDWYGPIEAVLDGFATGGRDHGVTVRLCPDIVRDNGLDDAERTLEVALRFAGNGVVALNCAGSERTDVAPFAPFFRRAAEAGLRSVPHAGEWAGPRERLRDASSTCGPTGSATACAPIEDPSARRSSSPTRDRRWRSVPCRTSPPASWLDLATHPFPALRDAGRGGHAQQRRSRDVRRLADRRVRDGARRLGPRRRRARRHRADGRGCDASRTTSARLRSARTSTRGWPRIEPASATALQ